MALSGVNNGENKLRIGFKWLSKGISLYMRILKGGKWIHISVQDLVSLFNDSALSFTTYLGSIIIRKIKTHQISLNVKRKNAFLSHHLFLPFLLMHVSISTHWVQQYNPE